MAIRGAGVGFDVRIHPPLAPTAIRRVSKASSNRAGNHSTVSGGFSVSIRGRCTNSAKLFFDLDPSGSTASRLPLDEGCRIQSRRYPAAQAIAC